MNSEYRAYLWGGLILILLIISLLFFTFPAKAQAAAIYDNTGVATSTYIPREPGFQQNWFYIGPPDTDYSPATTLYWAAYVMCADGDLGCAWNDFYILYIDGAVPQNSAYSNVPTPYNFATTSIALGADMEIHFVTGTINTTLETSHQYYIGFNGNCYGVGTAGDHTDISTGGNGVAYRSGTPWFYLGTTPYEENAPSEPSIEFIRPTDGTSTTNDAYGLFWGVEADPAGEVECIDPLCRVEVQYWRGDEPLAKIRDYINMGGSSTASVYFPKSVDLANGEWHAQAFLYDGWYYPLNAIASSSVIDFTITGSEVPGGTTATTTIGETAIDCSSGNWFSNGFCAVLSFLFLPSAESLHRYADLGDAIRSKPPMGYFTSAKNALDGLDDGEAPMNLMSSSTAGAFSGVLTPLNTGIIWILWFWFCIWSVRRISHLEI